MHKRYVYTALFLIWGLVAGMGSPVQTAINARLRTAAGSPLIASLISFTVGGAAIALVTLLKDRQLTFDHKIMFKSQWWLWIGGPLGVIFVTSNILLLPLLGSALTVVAILCGQMMIALTIDHFGWFGVARHKINVQRLAGLALLIVGVILIQQF